jgi:hypothetical protein
MAYTVHSLLTALCHSNSHAVSLWCIVAQLAMNSSEKLKFLTTLNFL